MHCRQWAWSCLLYTSDLSAITGQKAIITIAKKSVANFKLREGMPVGAKVTLRLSLIHI